jgi:hypothetical protein
MTEKAEKTQEKDPKPALEEDEPDEWYVRWEAGPSGQADSRWLLPQHWLPSQHL